MTVRRAAVSTDGHAELTAETSSVLWASRYRFNTRRMAAVEATGGGGRRRTGGAGSAVGRGSRRGGFGDGRSVAFAAIASFGGGRLSAAADRGSTGAVARGTSQPEIANMTVTITVKMTAATANRWAVDTATRPSASERWPEAFHACVIRAVGLRSVSGCTDRRAMSRRMPIDPRMDWSARLSSIESLAGNARARATLMPTARRAPTTNDAARDRSIRQRSIAIRPADRTTPIAWFANRPAADRSRTGTSSEARLRPTSLAGCKAASLGAVLVLSGLPTQPRTPRAVGARLRPGETS